jgi:hypothetical protein
VLVEAAKLAPKQSHELALVYEKKTERERQPRHSRSSSKNDGVSARGRSAEAGVHTFRRFQDGSSLIAASRYAQS